MCVCVRCRCCALYTAAAAGEGRKRVHRLRDTPMRGIPKLPPPSLLFYFFLGHTQRPALWGILIARVGPWARVELDRTTKRLTRRGKDEARQDEAKQDEARQDEPHSDDALGAFRFTFLKQKIDKCARTGIYINIYIHI